MLVKKHLFLVAFVGLVLVSCNKYSEGPMVSLRSKSERVANTWKIKQAFRNGNDVTGEYTAYTLTLSKDGDASLVASYLILGATFTFNTNGTWQFNSDKTNLIFDYENNDADNQYQILKLKEDEMWLREVGGEDEIHIQPA